MLVLEKVSSTKREQDKKYLTQSNRGKRIISLSITETEHLEVFGMTFSLIECCLTHAYPLAIT